MIANLVDQKTKPDECMPILDQQMKAAKAFGIYDGSLQENERYLKKIATMEAAAGDYRISRNEFETARIAALRQRDKFMQDINYQAVNVDSAYKALADMKDYKKRVQAAEKFKQEYSGQVTLALMMFAYESSANENARYMSILDQKYRAVGGAKSVAVLEGR